jgi:hypothetical protein
MNLWAERQFTGHDLNQELDSLVLPDAAQSHFPVGNIVAPFGLFSDKAPQAITTHLICEITFMIGRSKINQQNGKPGG